ncbi:MAG: alanyl-tRNA editing protein [Clostridia bacterium]|nr:alanyl-tRNA editing protein [Clostridia bacterium]
MTRRLYYEDEYLCQFDARVEMCRPKEEGKWIVRLDRTAFFPEGGGQWADLGTLGEATVLDVHERDGEVEHLVDAPLTPGTQVHGCIDWERRFSVMQQHSGEHIFSGLVHARFGYDNVGFHIGSEAVTMDFNGEITEAEAEEIETAANRVIFSNVPIEHFIPDEEARKTLEYRSKKEIEGELRIVRIPGADTCACCGTHLHRTGEIGQIKLIGVQKYKSGVRVSILCGLRALMYERQIQAEMEKVHRLISSRPENCAAVIEQILVERKELQYRNEQMAMQLFDVLSQGERAKPVRVVHCDALTGDGTARAAGKLAEGAGIALVTGGEGESVSFALCSVGMDVRPMTRAFCQTFSGKGGGKPDMTQGKIRRTDPDILRKWLQDNGSRSEP